MINSAMQETADAIILDLEDAVSLEEKETGRIFARDAIPMFKEVGVNVFVRVNSTGSGFLEEDLDYVVVRGIDGIMLPKTETKDEVVKLAQLLEKEEEKKRLEVNRVGIVPLIESPTGVHNVFDLASASSRVMGVAFGAGDFLREMGVGFAITRLSAEEYFPAILYGRSRIAQAAKVAGVEAIDTPFFGLLIDIKGLAKEAEAVKLLGFTGKQVVHPRHVDPVNNVFAPSEADIAYARAMVKAYEEAKARGSGTASYGGRMIDYAMHKMGVELITKAEEIEKKRIGKGKSSS